MTRQAPLSKHKLLTLDPFLKDHQALSLIELHGFLTAIISGPLLIMPSEWMEASGISDIEFTSEKEAQHMMGHVMAFYNTIARQLMNQTYKPLVTLHPLSSLKSFDEIKQAASTWAHGYLLGVNFDPEAWFAGNDEESNDMLATLLFPIMSLHLSDDSLREEIKDKEPDDIRETSIELLPQLVNRIYEFWLERRRNIPEENSLLSNPKIGRNDPCPCNSGKKFKKCCLH